MPAIIWAMGMLRSILLLLKPAYKCSGYTEEELRRELVKDSPTESKQERYPADDAQAIHAS